MDLEGQLIVLATFCPLAMFALLILHREYAHSLPKESSPKSHPVPGSRSRSKILWVRSALYVSSSMALCNMVTHGLTNK